MNKQNMGLYLRAFILILVAIFCFILVDIHNSNKEKKIIYKEVNDYAQVIYPVPASACRCMLVAFEENDSDIIEISLKEKGITENDERKVMTFRDKVNEKFQSRIKVKTIKTHGSEYMQLMYTDESEIEWSGEGNNK